MTENPKTPAKKTIQDPPEYGAATGQAVPKAPKGSLSGGAEAPASNDPKESGDKVGGRQQAGYQQNGQSAVAPTKGPQNRADEDHRLAGRQNGAEAPASNNRKESGDFFGGPQDVAEAPPSEWSGRGKPKPVAQEGIARNPQHSEPPQVENANDRPARGGRAGNRE
jgi:hypothetical protein